MVPPQWFMTSSKVGQHQRHKVAHADFRGCPATSSRRPGRQLPSPRRTAPLAFGANLPRMQIDPKPAPLGHRSAAGRFRHTGHAGTIPRRLAGQVAGQSRRRPSLEASRGGAMPALDPETRERWRDLVVVDQDAATVGTITAFYLDRATGLPTWALVHTGWFTDAQTFVPLAHAVEADQEIRIPYPKAFIQQAPRIHAHQELSPDDEVVLSAYYQLDDHRGAVTDRPLGDQPAVPGPAGGSTAPAEPARQPTRAAPAGPPVPRLARQGPVEVVRSEEELRVGVRRRRRRLGLRKYVVTEYLTRTIPIRREEVRLEEVPAPAEPVGEPDARARSRPPASSRCWKSSCTGRSRSSSCRWFRTSGSACSRTSSPNSEPSPRRSAKSRSTYSRSLPANQRIPTATAPLT